MKSSKSFYVVLAIVFAFALTAAGCNGSSSSSSSAPATGTLSGTVDDGSTPLDNNVQLTIIPSWGGTAVMVNTDAGGAYTASLPADTYNLSAIRPGYTDYSVGSLSVTDGQTSTHDFSMAPLAANTYIGSHECGVCHNAIYTTFLKSAHPFKLNKIVNDAEPTYPFSSLAGALAMIDDEDGVTDNSRGTPASYADISYVIGGFGWKSRWIDQSGYIVTGSMVQYNLATDSMSAYHDNEVDKPYNCGNCHTTGWKHFDNTVNPSRQDSLAGMDGTFDQTGIQCESCHGAGSTHAQTKLAADTTRIATARTTADFLAPDMAFGKPVACSECHTRDGEHDYPSFVSAYETAVSGSDIEGGRIAASGGLIRHHEQYDELLAVNPDNAALGSTRTNFASAMWDCNTCHNTHTTTVYQDVSGDAPGAANTNADCLTCHPGNDPANANTFGMTGLNCIDCHMPRLVKSAVSTTLANGVVVGDIRSHIFKIDLTQTDQVTASGSFTYPWLTATYACHSCHDGVTAHNRAGTDESSFNFHP
jgi:hypothetical protein